MTRTIAWVLVAAASLLGAPPAVAADADRDAIDPDRPDISSSAKTVRPAHVQIESGVLYQRTRFADEPTERRWSIETTVRVGVLGNLELRVDGEPLVRLRGADDATDVGDFTLGAKWRFYEPPPDSGVPALAIFPFVKLPTAPEPIGTERADFGLRFIASFNLPADFTLDANAGVAAIGQRHGDYLAQAQASGSLSREIVGNLLGILEMFYFSRQERGDRDRVGIDTGLVWRLGRDAALDVAVGTSLYGRLPDVFVRAGGSVRFGR
jgi:hypothetical protein